MLSIAGVLNAAEVAYPFVESVWEKLVKGARLTAFVRVGSGTFVAPLDVDSSSRLKEIIADST